MSMSKRETAEDYRLQRKQQGRQTEQAILQAALELARDKSFDRVTVRDICARAGITTGAFYHHFPSKEDLLSRGFAPLDTYMERALSWHEGEEPLERLWRILSTYALFIQEQGVELVARYYERRLTDRSAGSMDPTRYTLRATLACLQEAQAQGSLAGGQGAEWTADFLFRHFRGIVIDWIIHGGEYPLLPILEEDYALFARIFSRPRKDGDGGNPEMAAKEEKKEAP